jgi:cell wall-associated NlpC family hydrolase
MSFTSFARATRLALVISTCAALCVPASIRAQDAKPFEAYSNSAHNLRDSIVSLAKAQLGKRYRYGGKTPEHGFDCSGLVQYIMAALNLDVPRTARQQARSGLEIERDTSHLLPGDLLTFAKPKKGVSHVGIYIGDGKFIQASSVAGRVVESSINRTPSRLVKAWRGARRLLAFDDSVSSTVAAPGDTAAPPTKGGVKD